MDGFDLLLADIIAEWYKGFDPNKVKYLKFFIDKWKSESE